MRLLAAAISLGLLASPAAVEAVGDGRGGDTVDSPIPVPSGNTVILLDVVTGAEGSTGLAYRFRFVAPWIGEGVDFDVVSKDMEYLCEAYALPRLSNIGPVPSQIVVSFSDRPVEFGETAPDVIQYFEAFSLDGTECVWEFF